MPRSVLLTFTTRTQEIAGVLQDASGRPAPDYTIVVFSSDDRFWTTGSRRVRSARPGTDGRYVLRDLPAGTYHLAAVTDVSPAELADPAVLRELVAAAIPIALTAGEAKVQDIRIAVAR